MPEKTRLEGHDGSHGRGIRRLLLNPDPSELNEVVRGFGAAVDGRVVSHNPERQDKFFGPSENTSITRIYLRGTKISLRPFKKPIYHPHESISMLSANLES